VRAATDTGSDGITITIATALALALADVLIGAHGE
jgi:hypothetical protein